MQIFLGLHDKITSKSRVFPALGELGQSESTYKIESLRNSMKERGSGPITRDVISEVREGFLRK